MLFFILTICGVFVGLLSAFFGVGGGVLIVPTLYSLFTVALPAQVIGTCLAVIFLNSTLNTYNFIHLGRKPNLRLGLTTSLGMITGIIVASIFVHQINPRVLKYIFAFVLFLTGLRTIYFKAPINISLEEPTFLTKDLIISFFAGILGGAVAGFTGLGGGIVLVPILLTVLKLPLQWVPVYSNLAMMGGTMIGIWRYANISGPNLVPSGMLSDWQIGSVNFGVAIIIFLGSTVSSRYGARLSAKVSRTTSKRLFVVLLVVMGIRILYKACCQ